MDTKEQLQKLILTEVKKLLSEIAPEAPKGSPYGQYLWAGENLRKDGVAEVDTDAELKFLQAVGSHMGSTWSGNLASLISRKGGLRDIKNSGLYSQYIMPPKQTVYRAITTSPKMAASILRLSVEEITTQPKKPWYVEGGGVLNPKGSKIQSWTTKPHITKGFLEAYGDRSVAILLAADPYQGNNDFYLNPSNLNKKFDMIAIGGLLTDEAEVISFGPVEFAEAAFIIPHDSDRYGSDLSGDRAYSLLRKAMDIKRSK